MPENNVRETKWGYHKKHEAQPLSHARCSAHDAWHSGSMLASCCWQVYLGSLLGNHWYLPGSCLAYTYECVGEARELIWEQRASRRQNKHPGGQTILVYRGICKRAWGIKKWAGEAGELIWEQRAPDDKTSIPRDRQPWFTEGKTGATPTFG